MVIMTSPPELGGRGWPCTEVKKLTLGEVIMYANAKQGTKGKGNMHDSARNVDPEAMARAKAELKRRRKHFTGKDKLEW